MLLKCLASPLSRHLSSWHPFLSYHYTKATPEHVSRAKSSTNFQFMQKSHCFWCTSHI